MYSWLKVQSKGNTTEIKSGDNTSPAAFRLYENYPNPFNPITVIGYTIGTGQLSVTSQVKLIVYDVLGREITALVNKEQGAGKYEVKFDGSNLTSGIYFYRIKAGNFVKTNKMMLIK
jgi:hypothetical protein